MVTITHTPITEDRKTFDSVIEYTITIDNDINATQFLACLLKCMMLEDYSTVSISQALDYFADCEDDENLRDVINDAYYV